MKVTVPPDPQLLPYCLTTEEDYEDYEPMKSNEEPQDSVWLSCRSGVGLVFRQRRAAEQALPRLLLRMRFCQVVAVGLDTYFLVFKVAR